MTSTFRFGTGATTTTGTSFGVKPTAATSATPSISPGKLTYEQLDATTKKLVEEVQYPTFVFMPSDPFFTIHT